MLRGSQARLQRNFAQMTRNGVFGDPTFATAAKGRAILDAIVAALTPIINDLKNSSLP
jgi:creatinine amidohydrolase/Fe(II)-dependent formamide hydrolase-like protein